MLNRRSCGPTVSRDLADVICSSKTLKVLGLNWTGLHSDFYSVLEGKNEESKVWRMLSIQAETVPGDGFQMLAQLVRTPVGSPPSLMNERSWVRFPAESYQRLNQKNGTYSCLLARRLG